MRKWWRQPAELDLLRSRWRADYATLVEALHHPTEQIREAAALELGERRRADALEPLIDLLGTAASDMQAWRSRAAAADALGNINDERAVRPLIDALLHEGNTATDAQTAAVVALGKIGDRRAVAPLATVLRDTEECRFEGSTQEEALVALARIGDTVELEKASVDSEIDDYIRSLAKGLVAVAPKSLTVTNPTRFS